MAKTNEEEKATSYQQLPLREFKTDEGWAWVILVSVTLVLFLNHLPLMSFGVLYAPLFERFEVSATQIAWINGLGMMSWNIIVVFIGPFSDAFGWRRVAMFGSALNASSILMSAYVPRSALLFLYNSFMGSIGASISFSASLFVISNYFNKRRGMALAISSMGICGSLLIGPPFTLYLNDNFGPQWSFILLGIVMANGIPLSYLYHPTEWHATTIDPEVVREKLMAEERISFTKSASHKTNVIPTSQSVKIHSSLKEKSALSLQYKIALALKTTVTNFGFLKERRVLHICLAAPFSEMGWITFPIWIPFAIVNRGFALETASLCMSASGIANFSGQLFVAIFSDYSWFNRLFLYKMSILTNALSIVFFGFSAQLVFVVVFVCVWGFSCGLMMVLFPISIIEVMGFEKFPVVFGISKFMGALIFASATPLIGYVKDQSANFEIPLSMIAALIMVAFFLWLTMPCAEAHDLREKKKLERADKIFQEAIQL